MSIKRNTMPPVLIEPDEDVRPTKKVKIDADATTLGTVVSLLSLKSQGSFPELRPLHHPPLLSSFALLKPKKCRRRPIAALRSHGGITAISDDEDDEQVPCLDHGCCRPSLRPLHPTSIAIKGPTPQQKLLRVLLQGKASMPCCYSIPLGKPLPPAPSLPRLRPGQKVLLSYETNHSNSS